MAAVFVFLEGLMAFISPCILPMLPIYLVYLSGEDDRNTRRLVVNTLGFILGFTMIFTALGATSTMLGTLLSANKLLLQRVSGGLICLFGLSFILKIPIFWGFGPEADTKNLKFFKSMLFGMAFTFTWTPCLGAFLGSALVLASNADTLLYGVWLLFLFSMGLAVPFLLTALFFKRLQSLFGFAKRNFAWINLFSGVLLITVGVMMLFDIFGYYAGLFNW